MASQSPEVTSQRTTALPPYLRPTQRRALKRADTFLAAAEIESVTRRFIINHPTVMALLDTTPTEAAFNRHAVDVLARDCIEQIKGAQALAGMMLRQADANRQRIATVNAEAEIRINQLLMLQESIGTLPTRGA